MHEAKTKLSQLVERAQAGEDVVITRHGTPVARLVPVAAAKPRSRRCAGSAAARCTVADDFDELPDDIAEAFGMR